MEDNDFVFKCSSSPRSSLTESSRRSSLISSSPGSIESSLESSSQGESQGSSLVPKSEPKRNHLFLGKIEGKILQFLSHRGDLRYYNIDSSARSSIDFTPRLVPCFIRGFMVSSARLSAPQYSYTRVLF